ncbi:MAG TPA: ABC transporter permease [Spirochaetia bacterium]|nr:ABC transporter permease [Spirochaetia bacterium]
MLRRSLSLARNTIRLYLSDPAPLMVFIFMPLGLMAFLAPASRALLVAQGYAHAGGAEQAVPGMTVMFSFFVIGVIGIQFYREQGWGTWDRLRVASGTLEILVGKIVPGFLLLFLQLGVVFAAGALLFRLHVAGSLAALALIAMGFALCIMALTMALIAWCRTLDQLNVLANVFAIVLSGLGGSFAPVSELPGWAQAAARASPAYWAMQGMRRVILDGEGMRTALATCLALACFAGLFTLLTVVRFNVGEVKNSET